MNFKYYQISKKSAYAIEALLELALRGKAGPANVRNLANARQIPLRFLEVILNELKQGGFVRSVRGKTGGYLLTDPPKTLGIGQIILFLEKMPSSDPLTNYDSSVAVKGLMVDVNTAIANLFESTSLQDLVDREIQAKDNYIANYTI